MKLLRASYTVAMRLTAQPTSKEAWGFAADLATQLQAQRAIELLDFRVGRGPVTEPRRCDVELEARVRSRSGPAATAALYREVSRLAEPLGFALRVDEESASTTAGQMIYRYVNPSASQSNPGRGEDDGIAGVREPRRPKPSPGNMAAHSDIPQP